MPKKTLDTTPGCMQILTKLMQANMQTLPLFIIAPSDRYFMILILCLLAQLKKNSKIHPKKARRLKINMSEFSNFIPN